MNCLVFFLVICFKPAKSSP